MAKEIIIQFKLNGITQSITDVTSLNTKVDNLQQKFVETTTSGKAVGDTIGASFKTVSTSAQDAVSNVGNFSDSLNNIKDNEKPLGSLNDKIKDTGSNLENTGKKSQSFGQHLEKSSKGASQAINGLATGLQLVGVQDENINKVATGLSVMAELLKAQEVLSKNAFGDKGILQQFKSLGQLITTKKTSIALSEEQAGASVVEAGATGSATVATTAFGTALKALPWGWILAAVGAVIAAYELFGDTSKEEAEKANEALNEQLDILNSINDASQNITKNATENKAATNDAEIAGYEKQLQLVISTNGSLKEQNEIQKNIIVAKQKKIQIELDGEVANQRNLLIGLNEQKDLIEKKQKLVDDGTLSSDKQKETQKEINDLTAKNEKDQQLITESFQKQNRLSSDLTLSKQFDLKIQQASTAEKAKQLKLEREQFEIDLKKREKDTKELIQKIKFDVDTDELKKQLKEIEEQIGRFGSKGSEVKLIDINVESVKADLKLSLDAIQKSLNIELRETLNSEEEKRKSTVETLQSKIDAAKKSLDYDKLTASQRIKLNEEIKINSQAIDEANTIFYKSELDKRSDALDKFDKEIAKKGLVGNDKIKTNTDGQTQGTTLADDNGDSFKKRFDDFAKSENEIATLKKQSLQDTIDADEKALESAQLTNDKKEKLEIQIANLKVRQNEIVGESNKTISDKFIELSEQAKQAAIKANEEVKKEIEGKKLTKKELLEVDVEFRIVDEQVDKELKEVIGNLNTAMDEKVAIAKEEQDKLSNEVENGSVLRIGLYKREGDSIKKQLKSAGDEITEEAKKAQAKAIKELDGLGLSPDKYKIELDKINAAFSKLYNDIDKKTQLFSEEWLDKLNKTLNKAKVLISTFGNIALDIWSALNEAQNIRDEMMINQIESDFEKKQEIMNAELEAHQKVEDEKAQIVQDSTNRIQQIENQLQGARGQRQKYLLALLAEEERRRNKAANEQKKAHDAKIKQETALADAEQAKNDKIKAIQKEATIRQLKLDKARTIVQGALAAIEAFQALAGITAVGPILGAVAAAAVGVLTALQVDNINQQIKAAEQMKHGGQLKDSGGKVIGESHDNGGVRGTGRFNNIEVEGDEFIVNKKSTQRNLKAIEQINKEGMNTTFKLIPETSFLSTANTSTTSSPVTSFNTRLAKGGLIPNAVLPDFNSIRTALEKNETNTSTTKDIDFSAIVEAIKNMEPPVVSIVDINTGQQRVAKIKELARV